MFRSEEHIREWAYDDDAMLLDQDEDLVVFSLWALPNLLDCAADPSCPKSGYILDCIDSSLMRSALKGRDHDFQELGEAISIIKDRGDPNLAEWEATLERRLSYRLSPRPADKEAALQIGHDLLKGRGYLGTVEVVDATERSWIVQRRYEQFREWMEIDKLSGSIRYGGSRHGS